ncbi:ParB/Sulfiredoxin [uncultured Caudovirales phage]|uniref:ParB/Sulfiredoxin n=1 Tax=uncultured Caudovirales phage TaxID=2100421 RepID=A0A6J7WRC3_9CAUD|nr:ParB/Sulfiredoxin [uncultured Caudovirales phage]
MGNTGTTPRSSRGKDKSGATKVEEGLVVERMAVDELRPWPDNPRIGDIGVITESLEANGQYRPLIVQKSTNYVIAGNHTLQAMQHLKWTHCDVTVIDVDEQAAKRIMLIDNRSQDIADYDYDILTEVLKTVDSLVGTGYVQSELDALIKVQQELVDEVADDVMLDDEPAEDEEFGDEFTQDDLDRRVNRLNAEVLFVPTSESNKWDIPELLWDMIPEIPDDVAPWCGPIISEKMDTGDNTFLYQYSTDSTRSMPWDRTIISFYTQDERFENWWDNPEYYITRMINANIKALVVPDYSQYGSDPRALSLYNIYRANWIGRFAQEAGIQVIPNVSFRDDEIDFEYSMAAIPKKPRSVSIQAQTIKKNDTDEERRKVRRIQRALDYLQPEKVIVYGGPRGHAMAQSVKTDAKMIFVKNRSTLKSEWQEERDAVLEGKTK